MGEDRRRSVVAALAAPAAVAAGWLLIVPALLVLPTGLARTGRWRARRSAREAGA